MSAGFRQFPVTPSLRDVYDIGNGIMQGRVNDKGTVTLEVSAATTVVSDTRVGPNSVITFMPTTANAAAEIGNGTMYVSARSNGSFTITHANNAQADRTYGYRISS